MGKKKGKTKGIKPWYSQYNQVYIPQLLTGVIPKRIRNIEAAKTRLNMSRSANAVDHARDQINSNLAIIDDAYSKIRNALLDGDDMQRWKEFPGLEAAVEQVNNIDLLDLRAKAALGRSLSFDVPRFVVEPSLGNTNLIQANPVATGANGEPLRKHIKNKIKVEFDDDIEEGEIVIKDEDEDEPGVPLGINSPECQPSPEPVDLNHESQAEPHQFGYPYTTGFGNYSPGPPAQWMPQLPSPRPFHPPNDWHGVPNHYWHTPHPAFYPVMPHHNSGSVTFASGGIIRQPHPQFRFQANYPYPPSHAVPQHFGTPVATPPGISPGPLLPAPSIPTPSIAPASPIQPSKALPTPSLENAPTSSPLVAKQPRDELSRKRKLSDSPGSSSGTSRPFKRRISPQRGILFDVGDNRHNQFEFSRSASGPPDFGAWFQEQVADRKKKLSQLDRASKPTGDWNGA